MATFPAKPLRLRLVLAAAKIIAVSRPSILHVAIGTVLAATGGPAGLARRGQRLRAFRAD